MAHESLAEARRGIEDALARMVQVKKEGGVARAIPELVTTISVHFLNLRQMNRVILQEEDRVKTETEAAKSPLDNTTLQLHNLLYERNHYLKAIKACKDFKSKYPDIELVPEEMFFTDAPEEMQADPALKTDPHKLMLQRLNFEMLQRKNLCKQRELLEARKKMLQETISNRKKFLASLPSHLKDLKKASLPVQQHLGILHTKRMKQHQLADLLPAPLYVLYTQLLSYKEAFTEPIEVEVTGSAKEAQKLLKQHFLRETGGGAAEAEDENIDDDDDSQRRRKRARKSQSKHSGEASVFQSHPLAIVLQVFDDEEVARDKATKLLTLKFEYVHKLNVVSVATEGDADQITLLANLFPDDTGIDLPNQAAKLVIDDKTAEDFKRASRWFKWAQHLAGLDFLSETSNLSPEAAMLMKTSVSAGLATYRQQHRVQTVLQQLRNRKKSQLALKEQLDSLQMLIKPAVKSKAVAWASHVSTCQLRSWKSSDELETSLLLLESDGAGREDGELPPSGSVPYKDINSNPASFQKPSSTRTASPLRNRSHPVLDMDLNVSAVEYPDEDDVMECELVEQQQEEVPVIDEYKAVKPSWKEHGCRHFVAVLRRDAESSGRVFELEAMIKVGMDYPVRPPLFRLRLVSGARGLGRPDVPAGVADTVEEAVQGESKSEWFNELRAVEAKINSVVLPKWEEDYVLAHQVAHLVYLFDSLVDEELTTSVGDRTHRGRDRRHLLNW